MKLVALEFEGYVLFWWTKYEKDIIDGKNPKICTWNNLQNALRKKFMPLHEKKKEEKLKVSIVNPLILLIQKILKTIHLLHLLKFFTFHLLLQRTKLFLHLFSSKPKFEENTSSMKCFKCLGSGHIALDCLDKRGGMIKDDEKVSSLMSSSSFPKSLKDKECGLLMVRLMVGHDKSDLKQTQREYF